MLPNTSIWLDDISRQIISEQWTITIWRQFDIWLVHCTAIQYNSNATFGYPINFLGSYFAPEFTFKFDYMTSNLEANAFDVSPAMVSHLTSYRGCALNAKWDIFFLVTKMSAEKQVSCKKDRGAVLVLQAKCLYRQRKCAFKDLTISGIKSRKFYYILLFMLGPRV